MPYTCLAYFKIASEVVTHPKFSIFMIVHACRSSQNKTAKSSIDAILKLAALPMSRCYALSRVGGLRVMILNLRVKYEIVYLTCN